MKKYKIILFLIILFTNISYSEDCSETSNSYKLVNCKKCIRKDYKMYQTPRNVKAGINDTLTFDIVFKGGRDYIISLCADDIYYPIYIKIIQPATGEELYNNSRDDCFESIGVGFINTQSLIIKVAFGALKFGKNKIKSKDEVCVGFILQWKKTDTKND